MIASSILNPVMFKNLSGNYANMWNTLHVNRKQGGARVIPYYQKFTKNHTLYLQFESDSDAAIILKSYAGTVEIETFTENYDSTAGISSVRYYTNFTVILDSPYFDKAIYFKATQGSDTLTSEPVWVSDLTDLIARE